MKLVGAPAPQFSGYPSELEFRHRRGLLSARAYSVLQHSPDVVPKTSTFAQNTQNVCVIVPLSD